MSYTLSLSTEERTTVINHTISLITDITVLFTYLSSHLFGSKPLKSCSTYLLTSLWKAVSGSALSRVEEAWTEGRATLREDNYSSTLSSSSHSSSLTSKVDTSTQDRYYVVSSSSILSTFCTGCSYAWAISSSFALALHLFRREILILVFGTGAAETNHLAPYSSLNLSSPKMIA